MATEEQTAALKEALAAFAGLSVESITDFVFGLELAGESPSFYTGWSSTPHWRLMGMTDEIRLSLEDQRTMARMAEIQRQAIAADPATLQRMLGNGDG